jgi:predicted RNA-binding protein with PIN domain
MHLIIDGYNLLGFAGRMGHAANTATGSRGTVSTSREAARELLLRDLAAYRQRKGHAVTVVFDGWKEGFPAEHHEHRAGVKVIYSRRGEKADAVIQRLSEEYGSDCAVVSSDREVADFAKGRGAFVISASEFAATLTARSGPASQHAGAMSSKMSRNVRDEDESSTRRPDKKGNPRKLPKRLRQRQQRLKRF